MTLVGALAVWLSAAAVQGEAPPLGPELLAVVKEKETEVRAVRAEGIRLLEEFLKGSPDSNETAEALFKLAELTWEDAQAAFIDRMGAYQELQAACRQDRSQCPQLPKRAPTLDLSRSQSTYQRLIKEYPKFRKLDTVIYLYAFSLRDQGKSTEAIGYFERLLTEYPRSRFRADAWMALAEHRFYDLQDFRGALAAYERVVKYPRSPLHGLSLFKTAWCFWKLGQTDKAAARFKDVLDLGAKAKDRSLVEQKRAAELQDQALDYLVELFTEDDTKSAEDAYAFLSQIGGKAHALKVMRRFADTVFDQTRYERAAQAYIFLISLDISSAEAPGFQKRVVESFQALGRLDRATAEMRKLATTYGGKGAWAQANADRPEVVKQARALAEELIRTQAKAAHAEAQRNERESKTVDKERYAQAAEAYRFYLEQFPDASDATELRYLRADVLYFKLKDLRNAGTEYLAVGRVAPVGKFHKDALLNAMNAFEKLRPAVPAGGAGRKKREVTEDDRRFAESADLYATNFPADPEIVTVIFKNGQFFYDYADFDEAVKRFGLIIEKYPQSPVAGPAGERLLECLAASKDYANIEDWSRRLKKTRAFASRNDQDRLDGLIVGAIVKAGEAAAAKDDFPKAAGHFLRAARDFPQHPGTAKALANAGAAFERAGKPEAAVNAYRVLGDRHPRAPETPGALFVAGRIEESIGAYAAAAALYEKMAAGYPQAPDAPTALRQAGLLRQTLGQYDRAAVHYTEFERQYRGRPEARQVAFQKGLVLVEKKDWKGAAAAFGDYTKAYGGDANAVEAWVRKGEAHLALSDEGAAKDAFGKAISQHKGLRKEAETAPFAAQARYLQGDMLFRDYERIKIAGRPRQLARALEDKAKLLDDAKKIYLDVLSYRTPEWATAALLRIGQGYQIFAKAMRNAKIPKELSADEQQVYRDELEKHVVVIEDKAIESYRSGYAKAMELGVYNKHTRALRQALGELDSSAYPRESELRPLPRSSQTEVALEAIEEIRR